MKIIDGRVVPVSSLKWNTPPIHNVTHFPWNPNKETSTYIANYESFEKWKSDILERYRDISVKIVKNRKKKFWYQDDYVISFI